MVLSCWGFDKNVSRETFFVQENESRSSCRPLHSSQEKMRPDSTSRFGSARGFAGRGPIVLGSGGECRLELLGPFSRGVKHAQDLDCLTAHPVRNDAARIVDRIATSGARA